MTDVRREIARIVEKHLDEILDRTLEAFAAAVPRLASADERTLARVRAATRNATLAFLAVYADPETPARPLLDEARRGTIDRAGEQFAKDEILTMMRIAPQVIYQVSSRHVRREMGEDPARERDSAEAMESFLEELERAERRSSPRGDPMDDLLSAAEREGPDIR